jgi:hypothetical protein
MFSYSRSVKRGSVIEYAGESIGVVNCSDTSSARIWVPPFIFVCRHSDLVIVGLISGAQVTVDDDALGAPIEPESE